MAGVVEAMRKARFVIGVFVIVFNDTSEVLLVKHRYGKRKWSLPGGALHEREQVYKGAIREVKEETGLDIDIDHVLGIYDTYCGEEKTILLQGKIIGGSLHQCTEEIEDCRFFALDALPWDEIYPLQQQMIREAFSL